MFCAYVMTFYLSYLIVIIIIIIIIVYINTVTSVYMTTELPNGFFLD